jgi:eukaryotic-like serine/threonine-protein kinase
MDPDRWRRVKTICASVLELEPGRRPAAVAELCEGDAPLRADVEALLDAGTDRPDVLDRPIWAPTWIPERVGRYRIVRLVGEGGMGAVFEAEQDVPRRIVALKLIKPGLAGPDILRRFGLETQALGRLQHPGIAQIYEAGTADTHVGLQPYLAMEFINGETLRSYVESRRLTVPQRLDLMAKICDAVHHAHQRGLIHRDLKPGNILVDENGQPKVLDFGVARLVHVDPFVSRQTDVGQLVGTLAYMSPEQVQADPLELDIRSDVYTLGVILYELLAGRLPHVANGLPHDITRAICEEDPRPLSTIDGTYRGDLETIAAKALEKEKERRYSSAAALASDIRRYLHDEPIAARPQTAAYQLRKFAKRNRGLVVAVATVITVLVAGIVGTSVAAVRARRAQVAAQAAEQTAQAVSAFLQNDLLAQAGPSAQAGPTSRPDPDVKVRTALDRAAAVVGQRFPSQPLVEAAVRRTIGETYRDLGLFPEAQRQVEAALQLHRRLLGDRDATTVDTLNALASLFWLQGKYAAAEPLFVEIVDARRQLSGDTASETLTAMNNLGLLYSFEGKLAQAEPLLEQTLAARRQLSGETNLETITSTTNLSQLYDREGKYAEAARLGEAALAARRRVSGPEHPDTLTVMNNLSSVYRNQGRYAEAAALLESTVAIRRRVLGDEHPNTLTALNNLGNVYMNLGRVAEAQALFTDLLVVRKRVLGEEHANTLMTANNLGGILRFKGQYAAADAMVGEALANERRVYGEDTPDALVMASNLGLILACERKGEAARTLLNRTLAARIRVSGSTHPETLLLQERLAFTYQLDGDYVDAEPLLARAYDLRRQALSPMHPDTLAAGCTLGYVQLKQEKYAEAETTLRDTLALFDKSGVRTWQRANCTALLGAALIGQARRAEGQPLVRDGYEQLIHARAQMPAASQVYLDEARRALSR